MSAARATGSEAKAPRSRASASTRSHTKLARHAPALEAGREEVEQHVPCGIGEHAAAQVRASKPPCPDYLADGLEMALERSSA
jgi:hypothetical protein